MGRRKLRYRLVSNLPPTFLTRGWSPPEGQVEEGHPEQTGLEATSSEGHTLHANSACLGPAASHLGPPSLRNWAFAVFILIINTFSTPLSHHPYFSYLGKILKDKIKDSMITCALEFNLALWWRPFLSPLNRCGCLPSWELANSPKGQAPWRTHCG